MNQENTASYQNQITSPRLSRMTVKKDEQGKELQPGNKISYITSKPFQRKPYRAFSRNNKTPVSQQRVLSSQISKTPINDIRARGLVTMSSLSNLRVINQEQVVKPKEIKRERKCIPCSQKMKKNSIANEKQKRSIDNNNSQKGIKAQQKIKQLQQLNEILQKQKKVLIQKNQRNKEQINLMNIQLQQLNNALQEKNTTIKTLKDNLQIQKNNIQDLKQINYNLQDIIIGLNKRIQSLNYQTQAQSLIFQDKVKTQELQLQIQKLRQQNTLLHQKVKYSDIQHSMMKKTQYQLQKQQYLLDNKNKKLKARLNSLQNVKKNIPLNQVKKFNKILQNSLSFSLEL